MCLTFVLNGLRYIRRVEVDLIILQVEDDEASHFVFRKLFEELCPELKLQRAKNGPEALEMIKALTADPSVQIALVILDVFLPMTNGWEVLEQIRAEELFRQIPVAIFTGQSVESDRLHSEKLGVQYIEKPGNLRDLIGFVKEICAKGRQ